ncbi:Oidioi.mRNA.OKI2018_I69.YSR.g17157.t1.cds [Oikopleura dioica]|uniref:Oidioi.mRNA.OKI2018_I69.YSR.g17157.t1.cds n=1 Tax=Oikopleura dioica TaxID=34765 RepID=A0ABN7SIU1_OIKDI|nr:Oidioi.mRNA.OKI2018_I69.YSR.g17157.t1.cds [Oikopleura dioica]
MRESTDCTVVHASHQLLSIGIGSNFGYESVIVREDDTPGAAKKMVNLFVQKLKMAVESADCFPEYFYRAIVTLETEKLLKDDKIEKSRLSALLRKLKQYMKIDVFGFNSAKFDLPVLVPYLFPALQAEFGKFNVIKKGARYFLIETSCCNFKDVLNFTTPIKLAKYLKQNGVEEEKGIWPYNLYNSIEELKAADMFPTHDKFYSDLKKANIPLELYEENLKMFTDFKRENSSYNMRDWLKRYNTLDVTPLAKAIDNSFKNFQKVFGMDPAVSLSLPGFAQNCLFSLYSEDAALSHSFHQKNDEIRTLFRNNIVGGLVNVFSRYTELGDEEAPHNAKFAQNGERFSNISFLDFNALYLWAENQKLPTTQGILWEKKSNNFVKNIMTNGNSFVALQWLLFAEENDPNLTDKNGNRIRLQHQYFRGEHSEEGRKVDGFAIVDGVKVFWEFLGCKFHKDCPRCRPNETDEAWERKKAFLESRGKVIFIHECKWRTIARSVKWKSKYLPLIEKKTGTEEQILAGIKDGSLYGFIVADVRCPLPIFEKFKNLNFPPVIQRLQMTPEMLSPYMKSRVEREKTTLRETVVQTFNGDGLLMLTETAKFYMDIGLEVGNITKFIQYRGEKMLSKFVSRITEGRIKAILDKENELGLVYKTVGNSSYGKLGQKVGQPTNVYGDTRFLTEQSRKKTFKYFTPLEMEDGDCDYYEITRNSTKVTDNKPLPMCVAILQHSKLLFLRFIYDVVFEFFEPGSYKLCYCDTDSIAIATTRSAKSGRTTRLGKSEDTFFPIVKEGRLEEFKKVWTKWFVLDDTTRTEKTPGLLKVEWETSVGSLVALTCKTYQCEGKDNKPEEVIKRSTKGTPHSHSIEQTTFKRALKDELAERDNQVDISRLGLRNHKMQRLTVTKKMLSSIFYKMQLESDGITSRPLQINGVYL